MNENDPANKPAPYLDENKPLASTEHAQAATQNAASKSPADKPGWERATLEKLAFAALNEQKSSRRWKTFVRLAWLVFFIAIAWFIFGKSTTGMGSDMSTNHTALVEIKGEIGAGMDASAENTIAALRAAFKDNASQAVVLLVNSPGGSPVQAGIINDEIYRLKAMHKKPVYAVVEESCASAAYYIAVAADEIYVDKASIVGSIGVLLWVNDSVKIAAIRHINHQFT